MLINTLVCTYLSFRTVHIDFVIFPLHCLVCTMMVLMCYCLFSVSPSWSSMFCYGVCLLMSVLCFLLMVCSVLWRCLYICVCDQFPLNDIFCTVWVLMCFFWALFPLHFFSVQCWSLCTFVWTLFPPSPSVSFLYTDGFPKFNSWSCLYYFVVYELLSVLCFTLIFFQEFIKAKKQLIVCY